MIRLFDQHRIRKVKELDGVWSFVTEKGKSYSLPVPGCLEQHPDLINYRGKGTYYKTIYVNSKTNLRFEFKGVSHTADVYFDGRKIAHHYNAYTAFDAIAKSVAPGEHELRVEIDNSFSEASALHVPNDYYTYGGITRPVSVEEIPNQYIKNVHFTPSRNTDGWAAKIEVEIENLVRETTAADIKIELANKTISKQVELASNGITRVEFIECFSDIEEWFVLSPKLYMLDVNFNQIDDFRDRVGFRQVTMDGHRLLLNGKRVFLKGFNRHEDYGTIGCAVPLQIMVQDMDMMMEVGANALRTCHYPNDERFLDLCDERGILVWEENHARGFNLEKMENPNFDRQCEDCINEMITQHYNHPSIVIWGILNECASETEIGRRKYEMQYNQIKKLDASRPTTSATCRHFTDICLDLPDIVSFNIYSGWYQDIDVKSRHEDEMSWIESAGGALKPVIVSEFGGAAMYGYRDRGHCKWSEERQVDIIEENLACYANDDRLSGVFIWQFADCRVTEEDWWTTRARCHNNKGLVDEYRRPKEAYDVVKKWFDKMERID